MKLLESREQILDQARQIAVDVLRSEAGRVDSEGRWPESGIRALQAAGLGGLVAPRESGGLGQGLLALAQVSEVLGQECPSTSLCFGMHCVGTAVISAKATPLQQALFLEPISRGEHLTTLSLSESGTGAHFYFPQATLTALDDNGYEISGRKSFVTNGGHADSYVVSTVAADPNAPLGQFSLVIVPQASKGIQWGDDWNGLGMRGNSSRSLILDQVRVPSNHLLGRKGDQIWYVFEVIAPYFLVAMAGTFLGLGTTALNEALNDLRTRDYEHSGLSLSQIPILQHRLGTLWSRLEGARRLLYFGAEEMDAGRPQALTAILAAKAEVADTATMVVEEVMTLMGGRAYGSSSKLSRILRDSRAAHIMAPTTDILRTWTGRALLGLPLLGE